MALKKTDGVRSGSWCKIEGIEIIIKTGWSLSVWHYAIITINYPKPKT